MHNRTLVISILPLAIMGALGYLFFSNQEVATPALVSATQENSNAAERLPELENQIRQLTIQVAALTKTQNRQQWQQATETKITSETVEDQGILASMDEFDSSNPDIDPFSAEGIALSDEIQSRYIDQVGDIYNLEELDSEWAQSVESAVIPMLTDITDISTNQEGNSEAVSADITVANFECRSKLCSTQIISGTMDEMLAYQNHMVKQTKSELPSIVFGVIKPYGNKFTMSAYLARDEYEFPAM